MQDTLDVSNQVAAELAGISDGILDALRERARCTIRLRGNKLTLEGDDAQRFKGSVEEHWRYSQATTLAAGSIEVQRILLSRALTSS